MLASTPIWANIEVNRILSIAFLFCAAFGVLLAMAPVQAEEKTVAVRVPFSSYTPATMYELLHKPRKSWPRQQVWGTLSFPDKAIARVPAVILMHGSGGVEPAMDQWVAAFHDIGVATFVVDSFGPRRVDSTMADQRAVPYSANVADALQALKVLAKHSHIDARRIGIMGFSRGGTVVLQTALEPFRRAFTTSRQRFAFHVAAYAGCNQVYWSPEVTKAPILNLVGGADDYTTAAPCEQLAEHYQAAGAQIRTIRYADAAHAWDSLAPLRWLPNATSGAACGVVRWDIGTWNIRAEQSGAVLHPEQLDAFFAGCMTRGAHVGRNEAAYRASRAEVQAFARRVLFGANDGT